MGLSGTSGPFRGAYVSQTFGTASANTNVGQGGVQANLWSWTVPSGMDIEIIDAQFYCGTIGTNTRVNLLAGGASILTTGVNTEQLSGVGLTSGALVGLGSSTNATLSQNIFGTTATSITNSVTPSGPGNITNRGRPYGAYVVGGATLSATFSNGAAASSEIVGTLLWFPRSHPAALRSSTE